MAHAMTREHVLGHSVSSTRGCQRVRGVKECEREACVVYVCAREYIILLLRPRRTQSPALPSPPHPHPSCLTLLITIRFIVVRGLR